ncbi:MAG TPA: TonB-dependent receptor plug domain-containing protein, partial [Chitinophagaceae bacterium]|nr:TonB-dependent receptor plug domain-containing protein [Chitinophagaceae bacterium]
MQPMLMLLRSWRPFELLPVLILSLTCLCATAHASAQNDHPVTLVGNGITLRTVFKAIKRQTGFAVMYSTQATALNQDEKVNVNFKNTPLDDVLAYVLRGKELDWKYNDDVLIIHKKDLAPAEKKIEADSTGTPAMITGRITDGAGVALPGATVQVKGSNQGTTTDENGNFSLPKVANGQMLLVSMVGYETQTIPVRGRNILAQMNVVVNKLDETVVIAYGTTTQRLSTGNVATIKAKDIEKQPVTNPLLALQGRIPGLVITQNTGISNGGVTVRIQGQNSLLNGNDPLYIIDGVPIPSQIPGMAGGNILGNSGGQSGGASIGIGNPLSFINTSDIESINVLKDADATAIYGSRAANGAILITTKKGMVGPTRVSINLQQGVGQVTHKTSMLNTPQYLKMRHEALEHDRLTSDPKRDYDLTLWDTTRYTDWQKALIGNNAQYTHAVVDISGGTSNIQYILGGTYHKETTVFPGSFADYKGAVHLNINNTSANQKFNLQLSANYMLDNNHLFSLDLTPRAVLLEPDAPPLYNTDGTLNWAPNSTGTSTWTNPLAPLQNLYNNTTNNLISNINVSYQLLPNLEVRTSAGYTIMQADELETIALASIKPERRATTNRQATYGNRNSNTWIIEPQITYRKSISKGILDLLLGGTIQQNNARVRTVQGIGFSDDIAMGDLNSAANILPGSSYLTSYKY